MVVAGSSPRRRDAYLATDHQDVELANSQDADPESNGLKAGGSRTTPLPKFQLSVLLYVELAERLSMRVTLPFIVQLVKETGITGGDITKVGYYIGLVESLAYFSEALVILQWGRLSDHIGRRPVLFLGLVGMLISVTFLGLSHSFWAIVASRALSGAMNGNKGVIKAVIGDISDETNIARGFSLLPPAWSVGNVISPLIGGMLQHPYERLGDLFHSEFWRINPYFLPCLTTAIFVVSAFIIGYIFLEESAPNRKRLALSRWRRGVEYTRIDTDMNDPDSPMAVTEQSPFVPASLPPPPPRSLRSLLTRNVLIVIFNWGIFSMVDLSFDVVQPVILSTPISNGGLGMSPATIGACLAGFGLVKGASSILLFPWLFHRVGPKRLNTVCITALMGCFILFPIMNALARINGRVTPVVWAAYFLQLTLAALPNMAYSCLFIYLTAAAPPSALGATNGLAQTIVAVTRCFGPASTTAVFALSIRNNWLGGNFIYVMMCALVAAASLASRMFPDKPWERAEDHVTTHS